MDKKKHTKKVTKAKKDKKESVIAVEGTSADSSPVSGHDFPVVGIGASAGGLAAFESFLSGMPSGMNSGMAFVLVQHLAPDHKSILTELIRRYTSMQVFEVEDGMEVKPNCCYIIPPNRDMALLNGKLQLLEPTNPRGHRLPIDFFFRSLAQDQFDRAIGIILSGTGSDGTLGLRAIKGEGGIVMVQTPESAEYDGMPRSAIGTGLVDYELEPAEMVAQLISYADHAFGEFYRFKLTSTHKVESVLRQIFILLRGQTGHDFSLYKPSTVNRRVERRMAVHQIKTISSYVRYLQQTPMEVEALFRDLLIGVTNFFRDREVFSFFEKKVIPNLFSNKAAGSIIRVWCPGCSTGEEAYSIAILLQEHLDSLKQNLKVQVFATDIDNRAIATARAGIYPASIAADVTPERLARFFVSDPERSTYHIHKNIRDMLIFSEQDVIKDPPFSKIDLISCRNLLIYMGSELQKKLIPLFHYALNPSGFLFLGTSESVGEFSDLFLTIERKCKLYQRKEDVHGVQRMSFGRFLPPMLANRVALTKDQEKGAVPRKIPLRDLTEQTLLQHVVPASALVNKHGDILYLHGRVGEYLELVPGEAGVNNILKMAREGLQRDLMLALHKTVTGQEVVYCPGLIVKTNGEMSAVNLTVRPVAIDTLAIPESSLYLVTLEKGTVLDSKSAKQNIVLQTGEGASLSASDTDALVAALRQELRSKEEYLQTTVEELETSNEELKSSNEEMQSVNEELQSTNEEMETSKEELQSVNEELATVNAELQSKVVDLSLANNDMNNLLAGTGIGTIFVDHQLNIMRFTPSATKIINLIKTDVGRPVNHIVSNLNKYDSLSVDVQEVLDTLVPKEIDVQTTEDKWYTMRILPYRTLENTIEGAVITFVNVTEMKEAQRLLAEANDQLRLAVVVRDSHDAITMQDLEGHIMAWNPAAQLLFGWSETEALSMNIRDLVPESLCEEYLEVVRKIVNGNTIEPYFTERITKDGRNVRVRLTCTALINKAGMTYAISTTERLEK